MASLTIPFPAAAPRDYALCALRTLWIAVALMPLLPLHLLWRILKLPSPWAMLFMRISARALGAKVRVHGKALRKDVFFVSNHISWHDIPILGGVTGTAFVAQDGVRKWPIIGWLAAQNRTIFISRTEKQTVADQIAELRDAIAENWSVTLFPEGTTSDGLGLLPFKPSLFATLAPPPKPMLIQPVWLDFGDAGPEIAWLGEETGWESAWRAFTRPGSFTVNVHFLEPFDPAALADRKEVCAEARSRMLAAMA
ncbi:PlsC 1-acyl-sn-glycerol-3-phosphate acyltransferase [Sphingomonadaceae bacterium]